MPDSTPTAATPHPFQERASALLNRVINPKEATLRETVRTAQLTLSRAATEHVAELEGTGHFQHLDALLTRAQSLDELAMAVEVTPVEEIPRPGTAWNEEQIQSFVGRLSRGTAKLLTQTGEWLKDTGSQLEARRCRAEADQLYAEAGAILCGVYGTDGPVPIWAQESVTSLRTACEALSAHHAQYADATRTEILRERMRQMQQQYGKTMNRENFRAQIDEGGSQAREGMIEFVVWGIQTFESFGLFIALMSISIFVVPPWGAILVAATLYTWVRHRLEIDRRLSRTPPPLPET